MMVSTSGLRRLLADLERSDSSKPRINSSVLVVVIILSIVFLFSGILHIVARCLGRRRDARDGGRAVDGNPNLSVRLQHLFSLHDSGVEQAFIDALPMFLYGSIRGLKDSADCAVCLTEFANEDKLRLLPKCKHAFHTDCIDTWLLSNSTCPLCRRSLVEDPEPAAPPSNPPTCTTTTTTTTTTPAAAPNDDPTLRRSFRASLRGSFRFLADVVAPSATETAPPATPSPPMTPGPTVLVTQPDGSEKTLRVELGKVSSFTSRIVSPRMRMTRSYSVGSHQYVVGLITTQHSSPLDTPPSKPTHRTSLSDGIPELASASHTPWQEDSTFWASRGLETPNNLSRVREIMTPSPGWLSSRSPLVHTPRIHHHEESDHRKLELTHSPTQHQTIEVEAMDQVEARSVHQNDDVGDVGDDDVALVEDLGAARRWEVSVDVLDGGDTSSSPTSKELLPTLVDWLGGRSKRSLVYDSDASPAPPTEVEVNGT